MRRRRRANGIEPRAAGLSAAPGSVVADMSATLLARGLAAAHGDRVLFSGLDLVVAPGDVAGLVPLDRPMESLAGGQAARASLTSLLLSRYDVFLLDEPTNDLDLDGLDRLERFVTGLRAGTVVVSHDREFLARTVDRVVEL